MTFSLKAQDKKARTGKITLSNGTVGTPTFMPVGTYGVVKGLTVENILTLGAEIILANTFHLWMRVGIERMHNFGGLHRFMSWNGPILTDSGGFQVWSLKKIAKLSKEGVMFRSPINGEKLLLTPEKSMEIQMALNSDIAMIFDDCTPWPVSHNDAEKSMKLSLNWAERSKQAFKGHGENKIFGIVQGSMYPDLRFESIRELINIGFDGYAIGGLSVGEDKIHMRRIIEVIASSLPRDSVRYLMGVGTPEDLIHAVSEGVDIFDCVMPTRNARNGLLFTRFGNLKIRNARFRNDINPIEEGCLCPVCCPQHHNLNRPFHSRAYIHHLQRINEMLGSILATQHNLWFYLTMMKEIRRAIENKNFSEWACCFIQKRTIGL